MYLYDLHDFHTREQELAKLAKLGQPDPDANPNYPPIPAELRETSLVVDAGRRVGGGRQLLCWTGWCLTGLSQP